ncbi:MAG: hypothetical protein EP341_00675 [Sphingomonadales bacterium]|nr:MAG: hypothetical protein EP341_00675 [Sphingomonadales bacterium]
MRVISLTEEGRAVSIKANQLSKQIADVLSESIGVDELEHVRQALKRADAALKEFKPVQG